MLAWLLLLVAAPIASALDFASTRGPFVVNNATQGAITMNGMWYSLSNSTTDTHVMDPLLDPVACTRDAALMAQVGINTIYVMAINPNSTHDDCFSIFNAVGIYVVVVLRKDGVFDTSYEDFTKSYTTDFLKGMFEIIDAVKDYDNLLGFDLGVLPTYASWLTETPQVSYADVMKMYRAFVRDTKEYISRNAARPILVGTNLHLIRNDERLDASEETTTHMHYFTCAIDGNAADYSRSDYLSFYNLAYFEIDPVEKQNASFKSLQAKLTQSSVPTWLSSMGVFDEADTVTYELRPDLLNDTFYLFNASSALLRPRGVFTGGARVSWTNTNVGWKMPGMANWGLTSTSPSGDVQLTQNYDAFRSIIDAVNPGSWLSGDNIPPSAARPPPACNASAPEMQNSTLKAYVDELVTITLATDWALPTRPAGLDALISSGAQGHRGQMVDVTITTIAHTIRDSKGSVVTDLVLKPSSSATRTTTNSGIRGSEAARPPPGSSNTGLSTGAKAGIGAAVGVGVVVLVIGLVAFFLLRRRSRKSKGVAGKADSDGAGEYHKAELATGPGVEKYTGELAAHEPQELGGKGMKFELLETGQAPVELPVEERVVEVPEWHHAR